MGKKHRIIHWLAAASIAGFNWLSLAQAEEVAVVLSRDAGPYQTALQAFTGQCKFSSRVFNMQGDNPTGIGIMQTISQGGFKIVVTIGSEATLLAGKLPANLPVVYTMVIAPLDLGKKNASGTYIKVDVKDQIRIIKKYLPDKKRIGILYNLQTNSQEVSQIRQTVANMSLTLLPIAVQSREEVSKAMGKFTSDTVDVIWMLTDNTLGNLETFREIADHCQKEKLPLFGFAIGHVKSGALAAFAVDYAQIGKQTADLVSRILEDASTPVVEGPKKLIVYVNAQTQKNLGVSDLSVFPEVQIVQ